MDVLPGAVWQDLGTGRSVGTHGDFFPWRLHTGEAEVRAIDPTAHAEHYYWAHAAKAGRRVAVIDQPLVPALHTVPGVTLVAEWHVHDQLWGRGSHPPELIDDLEARHGRRPLDRCDTAHDAVRFGNGAWLDRQLDELRVKTDLALDLLARDEWDLFTIAFSDGHCVGHQLWHLHDPESPWHEPGAPARLRGSVEEVYVALDGAIGRLVDASDAATTVVFTSHGMGPYLAGPQLLGPVLQRLGYGDPRRIPPWLRRFVPVRLFQQLTRRRPSLAHRVMEVVGGGGFLRPATKAMAVPNNRVGAVRLNVMGREPAGVIDPADVDTELAAITEELLALRQPASGELIVERVDRPADVYGEGHHPDLPDLTVLFRRDLGVLVGCEGPRTGRIHADFRRPDYRRTGDHTDAARLWVCFDGGAAPEDLGEVDALDLAPTLLALLGVPRPSDIEGRVVDAIADARVRGTV
jgi:predicted AlkP superfamily phosphohydrolase/phosphomutase